MPDQPYQVYVIQGRGQRDYADCQAALAHVPARMTALPFIGDEDELIARARDASGSWNDSERPCGPSLQPGACRVIEGRHGFAGAARALGVWAQCRGPMSTN